MNRNESCGPLSLLGGEACCLSQPFEFICLITQKRLFNIELKRCGNGVERFRKVKFDGSTVGLRASVKPSVRNNHVGVDIGSLNGFLRFKGRSVGDKTHGRDGVKPAFKLNGLRLVIEIDDADRNISHESLTEKTGDKNAPNNRHQNKHHQIPRAAQYSQDLISDA